MTSLTGQLLVGLRRSRAHATSASSPSASEMTRSNASSGLGAGQFGFRVGWISGQVGVKAGDRASQDSREQVERLKQRHATHHRR
jgi:hypothetical protein